MVRTFLLRTFGCLAVSLAFAPLGQAQVTFSNETPITIPNFGLATPSVINVTGYTGTITQITVTLNGVTHSFEDDMGAVFAGPNQNTQKVLLFDGPGDGFGITNLTWTFSDSAATTLPDGGTPVSGTFRPGQNEWNDVFSAPTPAGPYDANFGSFIGTAPDGDYTLFVEDFVGGDGGSISSWSITIFGIAPVPEPASILFGAAGFGLAGAAIRRRWKAKRA